VETAVSDDTAQERVDFLCGCDFVRDRHKQAIGFQLSAVSLKQQS
jgi:hypothetical protein